MVDKHPHNDEFNPRYQRYMDLVPEDGLFEAMNNNIEETKAFILSIPMDKIDHKYAPGKWTIREVFGHICDTERIFGYRTLCGARGELAEMKRADENLYVQNAEFGRFSLAELGEEFEAARYSNVLLFRHLPNTAWDRQAIVSGATISVRALGYLMVGHARHHQQIVKDRYLVPTIGK